LGRPYTDEERAALKLKIKETAAVMFADQGFKNFRIQHLTRQVGISLGGFYTFYKDKEALYEEILRDEKNRIRMKIITIIEQEKQTPKDFFADLSHVLLTKTATNKFYTQEYSSLLETLVWNDHPHAAEDNLHFIRQIRTIWAKRGITISSSDEELASAVAALAILCTHKDKIGVGFDSWYATIEKTLLDHL
jgi:AcrR family transcriptional regulator